MIESGDISDAMFTRLLRGLLLALAAIIGVGALAGLGIWAKKTFVHPGPLGAVDLGFVQDMIDHHEQAIVIANAYLAHNPNGGAAPYASEVLLYQGRDLRTMDKMLLDSRQSRGGADRTAMAWMGMGSPVAEMPGMQTQARIDELGAATGKVADKLFFELMTGHHEGGIHMAQYAAGVAKRKAVRDFATYVANGQGIEINEYRQAAQRLGLTG